MAPFRPSGRSNRSGRSQVDHDVFEGLPIKQWRPSENTVGLPHVITEPKVGDNAWSELPMPRDSHLLSDWTQALLREARRPRLAKRKEPTEDEKGDEEDEGEKELQTGFLVKKWSQLPAHLEEPEREFLAKRRKGLPSLHTALAIQAAANIPSTAATRKAKVSKTDAQGNTTVYEVIVPEGQTVEGEVQQDTEITEAALERAAPGTVIEGVGIANAEGVIVANDLLQPQPPPRRRNMPPKRVKKGGPGRGKKKVMFTGAEGDAAAATPGGTAVPTTPATGDHMEVDSARKDGEDGDDGEEDEEDDDDDREEGELSEGETGPDDTPSRSKEPPAHLSTVNNHPALVPSTLRAQLSETKTEDASPIVAEDANGNAKGEQETPAEDSAPISVDHSSVDAEMTDAPRAEAEAEPEPAIKESVEEKPDESEALVTEEPSAEPRPDAMEATSDEPSISREEDQPADATAVAPPPQEEPSDVPAALDSSAKAEDEAKEDSTEVPAVVEEEEVAMEEVAPQDENANVEATAAPPEEEAEELSAAVAEAAEEPTIAEERAASAEVEVPTVEEVDEPTTAGIEETTATVEDKQMPAEVEVPDPAAPEKDEGEEEVGEEVEEGKEEAEQEEEEEEEEDQNANHDAFSGLEAALADQDDVE
ncbi:hypothetical protein AAFC00_005769 [Neodothiora populina]|uniref:Apopolysialoglycoprotein n=1 Tax=Neodothiora populina TaxID=2781224 RepID=A0ABR3P5S8_9PEZI